MAALDYLVPISLVVIALLAIVTASYRQTLYAYPSGGGSYIVSGENLGTGTSLVRGGGSDGGLHADGFGFDRGGRRGDHVGDRATARARGRARSPCSV